MKKSLIYVVLTFLLSWPMALLLFNHGLIPYSTPGIIFAIYFMFTPLIASVITQKLICKQNIIGPLKISFRPNIWFLAALLTPGFLALGATAISLIFPGVSLTADLTQSTAFTFFSQNLTQDQVAGLTRSAAGLPVHPFILVLIGGTTAGLTINGLAGFGEELGWRGLMLRSLAKFGFWRANLIIGVVWGLWHLPFIIHGHNYPGYPVTGVFMMILWTIMFSPVIGYIAIRADSVLAAAIMHGALNGTAMAPLIVLKGGNSLQVGMMGLAGVLAIILCNAALIAKGKPNEWYDKWVDL